MTLHAGWAGFVMECTDGAYHRMAKDRLHDVETVPHLLRTVDRGPPGLSEDDRIGRRGGLAGAQRAGQSALSGSAVSTLTALVAGGAPLYGRLALHLKLDQSLVRRLDVLVDVGVIEVTPNYEAPRNAAIRYRVSDPAIRFYEALVMPHSSLLERVDPFDAFDSVIAPRLDTFFGHAFERFVEPTYERLRAHRGLSMVRTWSRWEGSDRSGRGVELDIVAPLTSGAIMTGSVEWNREPLGPQVFFDHLDALRRAADAGRGWAHAALDGPMLFLAAGGFDARFHAVADAHPRNVLVWSLDEVYAEA